MEMFTVETFEELLSMESGIREKFIAYHRQLNKPRFQIKDVGISSKLIGDWAKAGLLNDEFQKGKWREFSFIEAIWVKFIEELRSFGSTLENIKLLKEMLFPNNEALKKHFLSMDTKTGSDYLRNINKQLRDALIDNEGEFYEVFAEFKFSFFGSIIIGGLILKFNMAFLVDDQGGRFINFGKPHDEIQAQNIDEIFKDIFRKSFAIINISRLINKFFDNDKLKVNSDFYLSIMDKDEQEVMSALRSGNYKQITIKLEDGSITQLRLNKKKDDDMVRKISRLLKKGDYQEIHLKVRDGMPINLDVTDIIKIKK